MIYSEDVHEASMFFPKEGVVALLVHRRGLLPYVRRELIGIYGTPSTTGDVYIRFNGLKIYTLVWNDDVVEPQQGVLTDGLDMYLVREKGYRIGPAHPRSAMKNDVQLLSTCMSESDMWLYIADKYPTMGALHRIS